MRKTNIFAFLLGLSMIPVLNTDKVFAQTVKGDIDSDGKFTATDIVLMKKYIFGIEKLTEEQLKAADFNGSGSVNIFDLSLMKEEFMDPKPVYQYPLAAAKLDEVGWDLKAAFNASASIPYYGHTADMPQDDKTTMEWYAEYGFVNGKGNCYVMAAMFCEMAKTLGYDAHLISGKVPLWNGGWGPHSWVEVIIDGVVYVCDPDFTNETGSNGYLIQYGQSGTWRYSKESTMS